MTRQAIQTKWFGPTNFHGSRVQAKCDDGKITVPWDYELSPAANHRKAAMRLCEKLGWNARENEWAQGGIGNGYVFCQLGK